MKNKITFDMIFKTILLLISLCALFLLYSMLQIMKENSDKGRYQFNDTGGYILDTKTGQVKRR